MKPLYRIVFPAALALVVAAGCSKKEPVASSTGSADAVKAPAQSSSTAAPAPAAGRAVEITANDTMKFNLTEIRAKAGESLSVTLKNVGTLPKMAMGHNWVLLKEAGLVNPFIAEAPQAAATDFIPQSQRGNLIAATKLLGPNESETVTFTAPTAPGRYPYVCSFPGHFQVGMRGDLVVE